MKRGPKTPFFVLFVVRFVKLGNQLIKLSQQTHTRLIGLLCMEN
jgi:hypothetical protein